jgi:hypothetical protein
MNKVMMICIAVCFCGCFVKAPGVKVHRTHNCYDINSNVDPYHDYSQFKNSPCDKVNNGPRYKTNMRKNNPVVGSVSGSIVQTYYVDQVY